MEWMLTAAEEINGFGGDNLRHPSDEEVAAIIAKHAPAPVEASGERLHDLDFSQVIELACKYHDDEIYRLTKEARRARASETALLARVAELEQTLTATEAQGEEWVQQSQLEREGRIAAESALAAANARADKAEAALLEAVEQLEAEIETSPEYPEHQVYLQEMVDRFRAILTPEAALDALRGKEAGNE